MRTKKQICLSVPAECHARLAEIAARLGTTNSAIVEALINERHAALAAQGGDL